VLTILEVDLTEIHLILFVLGNMNLELPSAMFSYFIFKQNDLFVTPISEFYVQVPWRIVMKKVF
jgi:hypothetical protein